MEKRPNYYVYAFKLFVNTFLMESWKSFFGANTFSKMTFGIMTLGTPKNGTQRNDTQSYKIYRTEEYNSCLGRVLVRMNWQMTAW
jgi:hypothetical protein